MPKIFNHELSSEHVRIAKYIFKGKTHAQIASSLNCSLSSVSYKMNSLFEKFNVKNRFEFIINVFSQIVYNNKQIINAQNEIIEKYEKENFAIKNIILGLIKNKNNKENYTYWCLEAKNIFKN